MNKLSILTIATALCVTAFSTASAQQTGYKISEIKPEVIKTPDFNYSYGPRNGKSEVQDWVQVEVTFEAEPEFTDELTVKYFIAINEQLFTGEVTHINIAKRSDCHSVMYIPPPTLKRVMGGKSLTSAAFNNIAVQISVKGQLVAQKSLKGPDGAAWFQQLQQIPNLVLNKDQTPFAPLFWDRYEMIKMGNR